MATDEVDAAPPSGEASAREASASAGPDTQKSTTISRTRLIWVDVLIGATTVLLVVAMFSVYANRLLFSPTNWSNTSTQLLQSANVRSSTANYLVDQFYANVNVEGILRTDLPPALQRLAAPAAGAIRNASVQAVETALSRPRVQDLWRKANYAANQSFVSIVKGGSGGVKVNNGAVTLDLRSILANVAARLGLPSDIGARLPANIATLTVFKAKQLKLVQDVGNAIRNLALWLTIFVPILYGLALLLAAKHRRRTLITIGFCAVFAGVIAYLGRGLLVSQIPGSLTNDAATKMTINDVVSISTGLLSEVAGAVIFVGVIFVLSGWFAGPTRVCTVARRAIAPFLRDNPIGTYGITLGIMVLIFLWNPIPATGKPAGMIVFTVLALVGAEALRRQTAREFPDARPGDVTQTVRARSAEARRRRDGAAVAPAPDTTAAGQLRQLADLRDKGAISAEEYESAKAQVLHG